jgi:hypothetical protein
MAGQVPGLALKMPRVGDPLRVAGDGEVLHPEVYADGLPGLRQRGGTVRVNGRGQRPIGFRLRGAPAPSAPAGLPLRQRPVPRHAHAAERAAQDRLLLLIGVGPAPVRCPHIYIIARFFVRTAKARRACLPSVLLPRFTGQQIATLPEGRSILRRSW